MNRSQALSPHPDFSRKFVHDAKNLNDSEVLASTDSETSFDPHASHRFTPDFESESDEETKVYAPLDGHSAAQNRILSSVSPIHVPVCTLSSPSPSPSSPSHTPFSNNESHVIDNPRVPQADHIQVQGDPILTGPRVRFRSRVRISAGMGRRQRRLSDGFSSTASSISGSPSSSISAPLRTQQTGNNGWVPLGSRMNLLASQAAPHPLSRDDYASGNKGSAGGSGSGDGNARMRCARSLQVLLDDDVDEQTHLITSATRPSYVGNGPAHDWHHDDGEQERWWREQLVDEAFGKWPTRLLNRHWWWWHLEPILCCLCEPDEERE